jgi:endoglucanase
MKSVYPALASIKMLVLLFLFSALPINASYLHRIGNKLYDNSNNEVRLTGVNWFGLETSTLAPMGLWSRDWYGMLLQIKQMGFNCIRIPWCNKIMRDGVQANSVTLYGTDPFIGVTNGPINRAIEGKTPLQILDSVIAGCGRLGLKVILDNHSRDPDGYMNELLWYTTSTPESLWISDWVRLAQRYAGNSTVVGCDLDNEPHGKDSLTGAQWGTGRPLYDWRMAAEKCGNEILKVNPDVLILVEGVEKVGPYGYWWGGNLRGVRSFPVNLSNPEKLVYSPHEYGPEVFAQTWFDAADFPNNLQLVWNSAFGYINRDSTGHLLIGEFGIKDSAAASGKAITWFKSFLAYIGTAMSWTYWSLNPNSGDTGGLLEYDWLTPVQWKLNLLKPYMAPLITSSSSARQPISSVSQASLNFRIHHKLILLQGSKADADYLVTAVDGRTIAHGRIINGKASVNLKGLSAGPLVVTVKKGKNSKSTIVSSVN